MSSKLAKERAAQLAATFEDDSDVKSGADDDSKIDGANFHRLGELAKKRAAQLAATFEDDSSDDENGADDDFKIDGANFHRLGEYIIIYLLFCLFVINLLIVFTLCS